MDNPDPWEPYPDEVEAVKPLSEERRSKPREDWEVQRRRIEQYAEGDGNEARACDAVLIRLDRAEAQVEAQEREIAKIEQDHEAAIGAQADLWRQDAQALRAERDALKESFGSCVVDIREAKAESARLRDALSGLLKQVEIVAGFAQHWEPLSTGDIREMQEAARIAREALRAGK